MQPRKERQQKPAEEKESLPIDEGSLIPSLKEDVNYLAQVYNERLQQKQDE